MPSPMQQFLLPYLMAPLERKQPLLWPCSNFGFGKKTGEKRGVFLVLIFHGGGVTGVLSLLNPL